jgi:hypothetical protein
MQEATTIAHLAGACQSLRQLVSMADCQLNALEENNEFVPKQKRHPKVAFCCTAEIPGGRGRNRTTETRIFNPLRFGLTTSSTGSVPHDCSS